MGKQKMQGKTPEELVHELQARQVELERQNEELKKAQLALIASAEKYMDLYDFAPVGYFTFTSEGLIVDVNLTGAAFLGVERQQLINGSFERFVVPRDLDRWDRHIASVFQRREMQSCDLLLKRQDGSTVHARLDSVGLDLPSEKAGVSGRIPVARAAVSDITERKGMEQELQEKNAELEHFIYTISHDLKSPLVTVKTFLGYLEQDLQGSDTERIKKDMLYMHTAADKMGQMLNELLEMSRIGRIANPPVRVPFRELVEEALNMVAGPIADRGVKVQLSDAPITLLGDRPRLVEIWLNLVENAVKFMGDQASAQIEIGVERRGGDWVFFVRDNGMGIDPRHHLRVFSLFEKIDSKSEGAGLGLALVKRILELYRGTIWLESKGLSQGTCFLFTLPGAVEDRDQEKGGKS